MKTASAAADLDSTAKFRPNIVYIHSHNSGRYSEPYGQSVPTPHLQQLAQEGILFRKAFSAAAVVRRRAGLPCLPASIHIAVAC